MIAWLLGEFGAWIIGAAGGAALLAVAYLRGGSSARQKGALSAAEAYAKTRKRVDEVEIFDDPRGAAEWLRHRPADKH